MKNQQNFLLSGFAALALTLIGATPAAAEIAQRNVYRDAATTTVNSASAEEFAQLYNNSAQTTKGEIVRPADAQSALASKDFKPLLTLVQELRPLFAFLEELRSLLALFEELRPLLTRFEKF